MSAPELSIVVALISGEVDDLRRCLSALHAQDDPPALEILVPYDDPCAGVTTLAGEFPRARFIHAAGLDTAAARAGASREHHDTLRTIGLRAAAGRVVALTEDHAQASPTWCRDMMRLLDAHPEAAAVGGAVDCESSHLFTWAVYWCDFGRYQNPLREGPSAYVSDSNVAYRRAALDEIRAAWAGDYHETVVHGALVRSGKMLLLTPRSQVWQARGKLRVGSSLRERFVWARSYAGTRVANAPLGKRLLLAALSFALPFVLTWRIARGVVMRRRHLVRFCAALPAILLLQTCWAVGEAVGYVTRDPGRRP
jgi:hypothetical protein